jgi:hypothetical protein
MSYEHVSRYAWMNRHTSLNLLESLVVHETGGILGYIELPFLDVLPELPARY